MRRIALVAAALALLPASGGPPASANDGGGGCGRRWTTAHSCHLQFRGFPLTVRGDAEALGTAAVRVWISLPATPDDALVECSAQSLGFASCDAGFPDQTTLLDVFALQTLVCHVEGAARGEYWCQSALGL